MEVEKDLQAFFGMDRPKPQPGKKAPAPSQPWVDAMDLMREVTTYARQPGKTLYHWRDTDMVIEIDDETNEITDIFKDSFK